MPFSRTTVRCGSPRAAVGLIPALAAVGAVLARPGAVGLLIIIRRSLSTALPVLRGPAEAAVGEDEDEHENEDPAPDGDRQDR